MTHPKNFRRTFTLQQDSSDCGIACLRSIIRYHKGEVSYERIRELSGTTSQGTTLLGLKQAAESLGLQADAFNHASIKDLLTFEAPVILHVLIDESLEHYVVWYGKAPGKITDGELFLIGDPGKGLLTISESELYNIWKSRTLLALTPTQKLNTSREKSKAQLSWLLRNVREDMGLLTTCAILGIAMAALGLSMTIFTQKLVDDFLPEADRKKIFGGIGLLVLLLFIRAGLEALRTHLLLEQSRRFNNRMIGGFIRTLLHLPKRFFDSRRTGDLVARLNDTARIQRVVSLAVGTAVIDLLVITVSLGVVFYYSPQTGSILVLALPVYTFVVYRFHQSALVRQRKMMEAYALNESTYISTVQGIRSVKSFNKQEIFLSLNQKIYGAFQDSIFHLGSLQRRLNLHAAIAGAVLLSSILAFACYQVLSHQLKIGELLALVGLSATLIPQVANLCLMLIPVNEARVTFDRIYEFEEIGPENAVSASNDSTPAHRIETLSVDNITFRFPGRRPVLEKFSMQVHRGEIVGLVAESGTGKSTLIQLIEGFYQPESGKISINQSIDLACITIEERRRRIATVPQEIELFPGSVLDNILSFSQYDIVDKIDPEDIKFLENPAFTLFYQRLPQGLHTQVGQGGANLSGGQKQWIGIMRALIRKPELLLLDEATSAIQHFALYKQIFE